MKNKQWLLQKELKDYKYMEMQTLKTGIDYENYFNIGYSYQQYQNNFESELLAKEEGLYTQYLPINWQRIKRIEKTFKPNDELAETISKLKNNIKWLLLSEHWCGDAAQIMPVLNEISSISNGKIQMKIVYRDKNLELMNAHLTGTSMSIPKLIQLDEKFEVTGEWGPRPSDAQDLVLKLKSDPQTAASYAEHLHKWYAKNKQVNIQLELVELLKSI